MQNTVFLSRFLDKNFNKNKINKINFDHFDLP